jgi:WD40 repeat protein
MDSYGHGRVTSLIFLPDGKPFVVGGRSKTVSLVNSDSGEIVRTFSGHAASVWRLDLSPDGKILASADGEGTVKLWELTTGKLQRSIKDAGTGVKLSPDGRFLATRHGDPEMMSPATIRLWNVKTGRQLTELRGHKDWIGGIAFSPDGKRLASGGFGSSIRIWDISKFTKGKP